MPKITFIVDHTPAGQSPERQTYKAGETYDLEASYADKYVRRGWAEPYKEVKVEKVERAKKPDAKPADVPPVVPEASVAPTDVAGKSGFGFVGSSGPEISNPRRR